MAWTHRSCQCRPHFLLVLQAPDPPPFSPAPLMAPLRNSCLLVQSDQGLAFSAVQLPPTRPQTHDGKCELGVQVGPCSMDGKPGVSTTEAGGP